MNAGNIIPLTAHMTKREYIAALAMQGLLMNPKVRGDIKKNGQGWVARSAVGWADDLLETLSKTKAGEA